MKLIPILASLLIVLSPIAQAEPRTCESLNVMKEKAPSLFQSVMAFLMGGKASPPCGSLSAVFRDLTENRSGDGRGLESRQPFDQAAAQANLDAALRDAETGKRLQELGSVSDEPLRLFLTAAILDDDGFDAARDLVVRQLKQLQPAPAGGRQ